MTRADSRGLGVVLTGGTSEAGRGYGRRSRPEPRAGLNDPGTRSSLEAPIDLTNVDIQRQWPAPAVEAEDRAHARSGTTLPREGQSGYADGHRPIPRRRPMRVSGVASNPHSTTIHSGRCPFVPSPAHMNGDVHTYVTLGAGGWGLGPPGTLPGPHRTQLSPDVRYGRRLAAWITPRRPSERPKTSRLLDRSAEPTSDRPRGGAAEAGGFHPQWRGRRQGCRECRHASYGDVMHPSP